MKTPKSTLSRIILFYRVSQPKRKGLPEKGETRMFRCLKRTSKGEVKVRKDPEGSLRDQPSR